MYCHVLNWMLTDVSDVHAASIIRALMMKAACTSETLVDIQLRTRQYIPEDSELYGVPPCFDEIPPSSGAPKVCKLLSSIWCFSLYATTQNEQKRACSQYSGYIQDNLHLKYFTSSGTLELTHDIAISSYLQLLQIVHINWTIIYREELWHMFTICICAKHI
jgi:hypothetical protein